uniref:Uncharacterized protein n=1 Tax=Steinernema glaseri TaxID=37863 RepID=A0A1I7ZJ92_9BILA
MKLILCSLVIRWEVKEINNRVHLCTRFLGNHAMLTSINKSKENTNSYIFVTLYFLSLSLFRNFYTELVTSCYEFVCTLSCVLFPVILIWTHPKLKIIVLKRFARFGCKKFQIEPADHELTQTINNLPLIMRPDANHQKQLYFDELQKSWQ